MGPNKFNIGDVVNITSRFKIVSITDANNDIYYELVPYEESYRCYIRMKEQNLRAVTGKFPWGKED